MNKRVFGMAPGGRMALDRAANRRRNVRFTAMQDKARTVTGRNGRNREKKGEAE